MPQPRPVSDIYRPSFLQALLQLTRGMDRCSGLLGFPAAAIRTPIDKMETADLRAVLWTATEQHSR